MKLLCDLHISPAAVSGLRDLGHDAARVTDFLPATSPDHAIVTFARVHDWVVVTFDVDIPTLLATSGEARPRVIHLRLTSARAPEVISGVRRAIAAISPGSSAGWVAVVDDARVRVREMPLDS